MSGHSTTIANIHPTAIISGGAIIHESASIGPYAVIGPHVSIGEGTTVGPHAVIDGHTTIGKNCRIFAGASIGLEPQDLGYRGAPTGVIIGDRVTIREYCTIHRATKEANTTIGDDCFLMNYTHIAHDCQLGRGVIMANGTTLAGHVTVGDHAVFAGLVVFHQFVRVGRMAMMSGMSGSRVDVPPFILADGRPLAIRGVNMVGLRRQKIAMPVRSAIKECYRLLYRSGLNFSQALERIEAEIEQFPEVKEIVEFYRTTKRGVASRAFEDTAEEAALEGE
ncbi:MAG TPA: acyl-ACP--UDP-N-acetylglucosamine O-acyltransferase [Candidatus Obscuribacterales bacterium]